MTHGRINELVTLLFTPEEHRLLMRQLAGAGRDDSEKMAGATRYQIEKNGWHKPNGMAQHAYDKLRQAERARAPEECEGCHAEPPTRWVDNDGCLEGYCESCWVQ